MCVRILARRSSLRLALGLIICAALVFAPNVSLLIDGLVVHSQGQNARREGRPRPGKPEGVLPNLEDVQGESRFEREPAAPIPSTLRSPKNPLSPWNGRRVGDPGTRGELGQAMNRRQRAHASRSAVAPPPTVLDDQLIANFFAWAVLRGPGGNEPTYWKDQLRVAYAQGQTSLKLAAIELGKTLFESAEYAERQRNDRGYVYDLYKTYLLREPDASGWDFWESQVGPNGRENVRRAFEESPEFAGIIASIVPNGSATAGAASLISARVAPKNQPGKGMLARDANWSVPLLSLPGRAGLDLGLALSYSSLVWTRNGPYTHFDEDNGFPSPGFRLGFPTVQRKVFDAQTAKNAFLLITAAGRRVELRQVGSSNVYEAGDSSYLQLIDNSPHLLVRSTDGTQLSFVEINNEYSCTQVKDRNGNYLTINHNALGRITTITDTLGRVITFNYDIHANLISITQSWNGQPSHQWVGFGWSTRNMQAGFSNVIGPRNGTPLPLITQVTLNDTSRLTFDYNNALQVSVVRNHFDDLQRSETVFNYETPADEVPRLSDSRVSAHNWTGINGVPTQVITTYSVAGDGACVMTAPDGTVYKEYYGAGWQRGLTILSEVWSAGVRQKWTTTAWTQDNTSVGYELNPRVTETNVHDGSNRRRTVIDYGGYAQWGLPYWVKEYASDGTTEIRHTFTDYNLSQAYLERRIIGLVSEVHLTNVSQYEGKITYSYDDPARLQTLPAVATQQDPAYSTSFTARGNVTAVSRWDFTDINNAAKKLTSYTNYYTTGSASSTTDPSGHQSGIAYADSFSDGINRNTFAYPTTVTDADGFSSYLQYNFDFGATTRTQSPAPAGQAQGAIQTMTYNSLGQLERTTTTNNGAYRRFWRGGDFTASYATVNNVADESYSVQTFDGLGRPLGAASNHPGSSGGYKAQINVYDLMGRIKQTSNPTETNSSWTPAGDDAAGWLYTQQTYDWQGRPLITTNPDTTTRQASYSGCGCAGGQVVTLIDEGTIDAGAPKRRQQKIYSDVLGRTVKTELFNWQGGTVYSTTVNTYNVRDQLTRVRQYAGPEGSGTYQETTITYDGYGRLKTKHVPEQDPGAATVWTYNSNDSIHVVTDARGASQTFSYNNRSLVTAITYSGGSTSNVSFAYDAVGNRTSMTDGLGSISYSYDQLSRLASETRYLTELNRSYQLNYTYNRANQLTSLSLPLWSQQINYNYDAAARIASVTASGFSGGYYSGDWPNQTWSPIHVASFVSAVGYRASGAIKHLTYGNGLHTDIDYNTRLQATRFEISNFSGSGSAGASYEYYDDGKIRSVARLESEVFDRAYKYDHVGRLREALSGAEAHGGATPDGPFKQLYAYDVWSNTTSTTTRVWGGATTTVNNTYTNNRRSSWYYNANGFATSDTDGTLWYNRDYDAANRRVRFEPQLGNYNGLPAVEMSTAFDGNSLPAKQVDTRRTQDTETGQIHTNATVSFYLSSTALGGLVVAELDAQGNKTGSQIYFQGMQLAREMILTWPSTHSIIQWLYTEPVTGSSGVVDIQGFWTEITELDPLGANVTSPPPVPLADTYQLPDYMQPIKQIYYQVEGGPSADAGVSRWYVNMVNKDFDAHMAQLYWDHGFRDWAQQILENNPNVGAHVTGTGAGRLAERAGVSRNEDGSVTIWGARAAYALGFVKEDNTVEWPQKSLVSQEQKQVYRSRVAQMLKDEKCAGFIKQLLTEAEPLAGRSYNDVLETFDNIKFYWTDEAPWYGGHAFFENGNPVATINNIVNTEKFISKDRSGYLIGATTHSFFAETLHHVGIDGMYGDGVMAQALNNILVRQGRAKARTFDLRDIDQRENQRASLYWHPKVENYCRAPRK